MNMVDIFKLARAQRAGGVMPPMQTGGMGQQFPQMPMQTGGTQPPTNFPNVQTGGMGQPMPFPGMQTGGPGMAYPQFGMQTGGNQPPGNISRALFPDSDQRPRTRWDWMR